MRPVQGWLDEYAESHRSRANKALHWVCVPLIMLAIVGLLWEIPAPPAWAAHSAFFNWSVLVAALVLIYYYVLAWRLALGMTLIVAAMVFIVYGVSLMVAQPWIVWLVVFVVAWIGQFAGHKIEGKKPSYFKDLLFLLIGPLWLLAFLYRQWHWAV